MNKLEWWVILPDDRDSICFNVFNSARFIGSLMHFKHRLKKEINLSIEEGIRDSLRYAFWCKAEYEILAKAFLRTSEHKIDVYSQVMMNFEHFYNYLMSNWSVIPARSYMQQNKLRDEEGDED